MFFGLKDDHPTSVLMLTSMLGRDPVLWIIAVDIIVNYRKGFEIPSSNVCKQKLEHLSE